MATRDEIGELVYRITADATALKKALKETEDNTRKSGSRIEKLSLNNLEVE